MYQIDRLGDGYGISLFVEQKDVTRIGFQNQQQLNLLGKTVCTYQVATLTSTDRLEIKRSLSLPQSVQFKEIQSMALNGVEWK